MPVPGPGQAQAVDVFPSGCASSVHQYYHNRSTRTTHNLNSHSFFGYMLLKLTHLPHLVPKIHACWPRVHSPVTILTALTKPARRGFSSSFSRMAIAVSTLYFQQKAKQVRWAFQLTLYARDEGSGSDLLHSVYGA